eukprot:Blabericola_migrator_1__1983@NODE_1540_length_4316_cov_343_220052_g1009_i1_p2_GENE_NODE_1540_length_4316_cov_343_220052_g1009_i1NODE_1540_length_4316_cov_343_220052_g1009_i1_p2_ORF_typecomplete_len344_score48_04DUF2101/PF09874_9/0_27_NODE_1540_length_4316_cov_343_220052_g1009_i130844115
MYAQSVKWASGSSLANTATSPDWVTTTAVKPAWSEESWAQTFQTHTSYYASYLCAAYSSAQGSSDLSTTPRPGVTPGQRLQAYMKGETSQPSSRKISRSNKAKAKASTWAPMLGPRAMVAVCEDGTLELGTHDEDVDDPDTPSTKTGVSFAKPETVVTSKESHKKPPTIPIASRSRGEFTSVDEKDWKAAFDIPELEAQPSYIWLQPVLMAVVSGFLLLFSSFMLHLIPSMILSCLVGSNSVMLICSILSYWMTQILVWVVFCGNFLLHIIFAATIQMHIQTLRVTYIDPDTSGRAIRHFVIYCAINFVAILFFAAGGVARAVQSGMIKRHYQHGVRHVNLLS